MKFPSITCSENPELHLHSFDYLSQSVKTEIISWSFPTEMLCQTSYQAKSLANYKLKTINFNNIYIFVQFLEEHLTVHNTMIDTQ